jgi:hypothetical protein
MPIFNRFKEIIKSIRFAASPRLYGRSTAGAGEGEEITVGNGLSLTAGVLSAAVRSVAGRTGTITLNSSDILDASTMGEADKLLKIDENGIAIVQALRSSATVVVGDPQDTLGQVIIMSGNSIFAWTRGFDEGFSFELPTTAGEYLYRLPSGTGTFALHPTGPYANDATAASNGVAVGRLYYTAAGAVLRRMA